MKKIIFVIAVLLCAILCLTSCNLIPTIGTPQASYETINQLVKSNHSKLTIDVTTKPAGQNDGIVSQIVCTKVSETTNFVKYSIQQYATIDVDGETITLPENQIVTKAGSATFSNGQKTDSSGDQVDFDFSAIDKINLSFNADNFANAKFEGDSFTADVTNVKAFLGKDVQGVTNGKVSVNVTEGVITLSGTANGSDVTIVYTITK